MTTATVTTPLASELNVDSDGNLFRKTDKHRRNSTHDEAMKKTSSTTKLKGKAHYMTFLYARYIVDSQVHKRPNTGHNHLGDAPTLYLMSYNSLRD